MIRLALAVLVLLQGCGDPAASTPKEQPRPELALLTSLPIVFGESFSLDPPESPLLRTLEETFVVRPVDGPEQLAPGGLLLAVQPQALTAERLVALDKWVREGGRLVLLADRSLTFESSRPLGDRFRPPYTYADTGLLHHWGLSLLPEEKPRNGMAGFDLGQGKSAEASSFGRLAVEGGRCTLSAARTAARCRIGRGRITVVADADFAMRENFPANQEAVAALVSEMLR